MLMRRSAIAYALSIGFDNLVVGNGELGPKARAGVAAIPTAALDPSHSAASPAVSALIGFGSPSALDRYAASDGSVEVISAIA